MSLCLCLSIACALFFTFLMANFCLSSLVHRLCRVLLTTYSTIVCPVPAIPSTLSFYSTWYCCCCCFSVNLLNYCSSLSQYLYDLHVETWSIHFHCFKCYLFVFCCSHTDQLSGISLLSNSNSLCKYYSARLPRKYCIAGYSSLSVCVSFLCSLLIVNYFFFLNTHMLYMHIFNSSMCNSSFSF